MNALDEYQRLAQRTWSDDFDLAQAALGLGGEVGEVLEIVKKHRQHGMPAAEARTKLYDELGDVIWYLSAICSVVGLSLSDVAEGNIEKLLERYPDGFRQREAP